MGTLAYNEGTDEILSSLVALEPSLGPTELICMWFDDHYFPGMSKPDGGSTEVWERGQSEWRACFSGEELAVLEKFHNAFANELDRGLSEEWSTWRTDNGWMRVSAAAAEALAELSRVRLTPRWSVRVRNEVPSPFNCGCAAEVQR